MARVRGVHPQFGANFDSRFVSREGAKNAKERACDGFFVPSLEEVSLATEFRSLRVLRVRNAFAPFGECTRCEGCIRSSGRLFVREYLTPVPSPPAISLAVLPCQARFGARNPGGEGQSSPASVCADKQSLCASTSLRVFYGRFVSREGAKNAKEEDFDGFSSLRLRKVL